jgi:hypothetical protein
VGIALSQVGASLPRGIPNSPRKVDASVSGSFSLPTICRFRFGSFFR